MKLTNKQEHAHKMIKINEVIPDQLTTMAPRFTSVVLAAQVKPCYYSIANSSMMAIILIDLSATTIKFYGIF